MKLSKEIKAKIDSYFDNIKADELYKLAINQYAFSDLSFEIENQKFYTTYKSYYSAKNESTIIIDDIKSKLSNIPFAA